MVKWRYGLMPSNDKAIQPCEHFTISQFIEDHRISAHINYFHSRVLRRIKNKQRVGGGDAGL
jgi:hypothetical protein